MSAPVCMPLLTAAPGTCIKPSPGITAVGIAAPVPAGQSANNTHIGIEMCEPACIAYTGGTSFTFVCTDLPAAKAVAKRTYETAVELFAVLCRRYGLDPLGDGVILSHTEGYSRGVASNHSDPEHLWNQLGMGYTMDGFRMAVQAAAERENAAAVSPPESSPHRN